MAQTNISRWTFRNGEAVEIPFDVCNIICNAWMYEIDAGKGPEVAKNTAISTVAKNNLSATEEDVEFIFHRFDLGRVKYKGKRGSIQIAAGGITRTYKARTCQTFKFSWDHFRDRGESGDKLFNLVIDHIADLHKDFLRPDDANFLEVYNEFSQQRDSSDDRRTLPPNWPFDKR
ncbi:MAG: hypothetical protein M1837_007508 [Sclerophora amabilis]|nr:MAG: hypothetical protein M1837_007508 [Sclerophora amabilis]